MARQSDLYVLIVIVAAIAFWLYIRLRRWAHSPMRMQLPYPEPASVPDSDAVRLLEEAGYEVISGKKKVPLVVELDDEPLDTRLFVDLFARKEHELYVVKISNERYPVTWTASGIRDRLMMYQDLFKETHGVLYVDLEHHRVRKVKIDIGELD